jgi:hypothetical protein
LSHLPEHKIWKSIKQRCYDPHCQAYPYYGGVGIGLHSSWLNDFPAFYRGIGPRPSRFHSLDRYPNPHGNYEPGNVRWATAQEQADNKRNNINITIAGVTKNTQQWGRDTGLKGSVIRERLARGWTPERAVTEPLHTVRRTGRAR